MGIFLLFIVFLFLAFTLVWNVNPNSFSINKERKFFLNCCFFLDLSFMAFTGKRDGFNPLKLIFLYPVLFKSKMLQMELKYDPFYVFAH